MDHPLQTAYSPWRTRALVLATVAALELVLLLAMGTFAVGRLFVGHVESAARAHQLAPAKPKAAPAPAAAREPAARPLLERSETSVIVLNGNGISGAAAEAAGKVRALAYVVSNVGNAPRREDAKTIVMYRPGHEGEARRLAKELGIKLVGPLDGLRAKDLMGSHLAVVLGG